MTVKATYLLTIEGPGDFDFDLDELGGAVAAWVDDAGEAVENVELSRVDGAAIESNRISPTSVETRVTSPWRTQRAE